MNELDKELERRGHKFVRDEGAPAGDNESKQGDKQLRKTAYSETICQRKGELLQTGGYEEPADENG